MADKEIFLNSGSHKADVPKSTFDKSFTNHLTAQYGYLYPCLVEEAVAGSSYKIKSDMAFDMMPTVFPLQSTMRCHVSFFKVAFRNVMKNFKDFTVRVGNHAMPYISRSEDWVTPGSLADYMGVPTAQFGAVVREGSLGLFNRGNMGSFSSVDLFTGEFLNGPSLRYYTFNELIVPSSAVYTRQLVISEPLENPFIFPSFNISKESSASTSSLSGTFRLYLLVSLKNKFNFQVFAIPSTSLNLYDYAASSDNPQPVGTFSRVSNTTIATNPVTSSYYVYNYRFLFSDDVMAKINSYVNDSSLEVRLAFSYGTNLYSSLGVGSFSDEPLANPVDASSMHISFDNKDDVLTVTPYSLLTSRLVKSISYSYSLGELESSRKYFNVVDGQPPQLPINALPFRAYEMIYNRFFRNPQIDPFYKNGELSYNEYITNDGDGADSTTPVELKHVPYEYDVFTTALKSPQSGTAPLVGVTTNDTSNTAILHMMNLNEQGEPDPSDAYNIGVGLDADSDVVGISYYDDNADKNTLMRLEELIKFGISINDLRNVSAFQRLKEKMQKTDYEYDKYYEVFYGTTPPIGEELPQYLGGFTREIRFGKIQNTALTDEHPLGEFAGVGGVAGSSRTIKCYVSEPSYIIGLMWFTVTPVYSQHLPKHFLKFHPLDYFNPTFNAIGPQPIMRHELAPLQLDQEELFDVFGYQRPWYDYVSRVDECHGNFRTDMRNYLMQRIFGQAPELTENFINIHADELTDIFSVTQGTDKFYGFIRFDIKCKSPVARISIPRIIG